MRKNKIKNIRARIKENSNFKTNNLQQNNFCGSSGRLENFLRIC